MFIVIQQALGPCGLLGGCGEGELLAHAASLLVRAEEGRGGAGREQKVLTTL